MPPRLFSRHSFVTGVSDDEGKSYLTEREPFRYKERPDNIIHTVVEGDSFFNLAARLYRDIMPRPASLWWVLADYQPHPIVDPTIPLTPGQVVFAPSPRVVLEEVFDETRRNESNVT
jgi:hypothetical protein